MRILFIGGWGHHYLSALFKENGGSHTAAVAGDGLENETARRLLDRTGTSLWFDDAATAIGQFRPDVVSVGAVYGLNGDMAALALEQGIPVVSDKPVAVHHGQLERLQQATRATGARLLTELPFRCQAEFRAARAAIHDGRLGQVVLATAQKSYRFGESRPHWYARRDLYGGTLLWVASHGLDAIQFATGLATVRFCGLQGNVSRPDYGSMEDHCVSLFQLEGGAAGVVHADYQRPNAALGHGDDRMRIAGSLGVVEVRNGRCLLTTASQPEHDITDSVPGRPVHEELLDALSGQSSFYSTQHSLDLAATLLAARDGADTESWCVLR